MKHSSRKLGFALILTTLGTSLPGSLFAFEVPQSAPFAIRKTISLLFRARTQEELKLQNDRAGKLFSILFRPRPARATCLALLTLAPEELILLEDAIEGQPSKNNLPCLGELRARIEDHWTGVNASIRSRVSSTDPNQTPIEMRDVVIDPARGDTYFRADLANDEVALTFDDGPHPTRSLEILNTLDEFGVKATYFNIGNNAKAYPGIVREYLARGHTVGSHTVSHPQLPRLSLAAAQQEILGGHAAVAAAAGDAGSIPLFFRFPYGSRSKTLTGWVKEQGIASFLWNMDTLDWKYTDVDSLFANVRIELNKEKGGIMLFHDVHRQSAAVLPLVLDEFRVRGIRCVRFVAPNSTQR